MKKSLLLLLFVCSQSFAYLGPNPLGFYGAGSSLMSIGSKEVGLQYSHKVFLPKSKFNLSDLESIELGILKQVKFIHGAFKMQRFKGNIKAGDEKVSFSKNNIIEHENYLEVPYSFKGTAIVDIELKDFVDLTIPSYPYDVYSKSKGSNPKNPCTDQNYNSVGDFWYFWNINNSGCNLKEKEDFEYVRIDFIELNNTTDISYPEYNRLVRFDKDGNKKVLIYTAFGPVHKISSLSNYIYNEKEFKASKLRDYFDQLNKMGFKKFESERTSETSIVYTSTKFIAESDTTIELKIYIGNISSSAKNVIKFYEFFKEALEQGSIFYFGGHSGLGGYLSLSTIEDKVGKIEIPKDEYQIYFFDGCSTYSYYINQYFERKSGVRVQGRYDSKGTKNLDILSNGISSYFAYNATYMLNLLRPVERYLKHSSSRSYQQIIDTIYDHIITKYDPDKMPGSMLNVSGDEDNPTKSLQNKFEVGINLKSEIKALVAKKGLQYINIQNPQDGAKLRKKIWDLSRSEYLVYILTSDNEVVYLDKSTDEGVKLSIVSSKYKIPYNQIFIASSSIDKIVLYMYGVDGKLYYKDFSNANVHFSSLSHPENGVKWNQITFDLKLNTRVGNDENGKKWIYNSGQKVWELDQR